MRHHVAVSGAVNDEQPLARRRQRRRRVQAFGQLGRRGLVVVADQNQQGLIDQRHVRQVTVALEIVRDLHPDKRFYVARHAGLHPILGCGDGTLEHHAGRRPVRRDIARGETAHRVAVDHKAFSADVGKRRDVVEDRQHVVRHRGHRRRPFALSVTPIVRDEQVDAEGCELTRGLGGGPPDRVPAATEKEDCQARARLTKTNGAQADAVWPDNFVLGQRESRSNRGD